MRVAHIIQVPGILGLTHGKRLKGACSPVRIENRLSKPRGLGFALRKQAMGARKCAKHLIKSPVLLENYEDILHPFSQKFNYLRSFRGSIYLGVGDVWRDL